MSTPTELYRVVSKYFLYGSVLFSGPIFVYDAPFGRFSPSEPSRLLVDGIKAWIFMEIASPICFLAAFFSSPLTRSLASLKQSLLSPPPTLVQTTFFGSQFSVPNPPTLLGLLVLIHYTHRALISPLRTPVRSKFHISVPISAIVFNTVNGSLLGAFLSALAVSYPTSGIRVYMFRGNHAVATWQFWTGITMWAIGLVSNIWHDEVLLNIRRNRKGDVTSSDEDKKVKDEKPHYAIPYGGLYAFISYPNYVSEWFEWLGFAIASSALTNQLPSTHVVYPFTNGRLGLGALSWFFETLTPPWLFFLSEVLLMFPRAWNGHKWYQRKFADYPRERRCVIPYLL